MCIDFCFRESIFQRSVSVKSILKSPKLDNIQEEDEVSTAKNTPQTERKGSDGNSDPEADQIEMETRVNNLEPVCVKENVDMVDGGVTWAALPQETTDNEFEKTKAKQPEFRPATKSPNNEFEISESKLPKLRLIRIIGGMIISLGILGILLVPLSTHYFAKEQKKSYLFYQLPPHLDSLEPYPIQETHIIQVNKKFN